MADKRPRSDRPRKRGGKGRLADLAVVRRQQQAVSELQRTLQPEAEALEGTSSRREVVDQIRTRATALAQQRTEGDVATVVEAALDEIFGLGPLEPLLRDPVYHNIRVDGVDLYAEGKQAPIGFRDAAHARSVIDRIMAAAGKDLGASPEEVFATMVDGSTVRARLDGDVVKAEIVRYHE